MREVRHSHVTPIDADTLVSCVIEGMLGRRGVINVFEHSSIDV
jgi:hypothetical protein